MPNTIDVGPYFVHGIRLRSRTPLVHRAVTNEIEPPYRRSNSQVVRVFWRWGLVFGRWEETGRDERQALLDATKGTEDVFSVGTIRDHAHRFDRDADDALLT